MKRRDLLRYLHQQSCRLLREGGEHSIWEHSATQRRASIPCDREIPDFTATSIPISRRRAFADSSVFHFLQPES